jgi:hypothetical protein
LLEASQHIHAIQGMFIVIDNSHGIFFSFCWQKQPGKEMLEKLTSSYEHIYNLPLDEDTLYEKCQTAVNFVDKMEKDYGNNSMQGKYDG